MNCFDSAWNFIWEKLFCNKTELFYDYLADGVDSVSRLPSPAEIAVQFPNPCGWGTGMEDSMMSAGTMLETALARYDREQEPVFAEMAHRIFRGMKLCATVSTNPGFLARSVSPVDGHSHYINSSRDQYTHFVYAAWKFFHSSVSSPEEKADIQKILASFADMAIRNFNPEHDYSMPREDGKPGAVGKMWNGVHSHEVMRFPMFCMAAWDVTGDAEYRSACRDIIPEALALSRQWDPHERNWGAFALLQMQYSLRLVRDTETDTALKNALDVLMRKLADFSQKYVPETRELLHQGRLKTDAVNPDWRTRSFVLYRECMLDGYGYFMASHEKTYSDCCFEPLRAAGQGIMIQQLCPEWTVPEEQYEALQEITESVDFGKHTSYAPILLAGAWFMKEKCSVG